MDAASGAQGAQTIDVVEYFELTDGDFEWPNIVHCTTDRRRQKMSTVVSSPGDPRRLQGPRSGRRLPFDGHTYYLDLQKYPGQRRLERDIVYMGGKVDKFLSNQVTHVVTSKPTVSPSRSGCGSTPGAAGQSLEPAVLSRGLTLLKLSGRTQSPAGDRKSGVADRAKQLGVAVITVSDILDQVQQHVETRADLAHMHPIIAHDTGKTVVRQLRGVFMKIDDDGERFRPIMQRFQSFPAVIADSTHDTSPFLTNQHVKAMLKKIESTRCSSKSATMPSTKAARKKTYIKDGFCELCETCFDDVQQHRQSEKHKQYANCDDNYASLDDVIGKLSSIEDMLSTFHSVSSARDCLCNTACHADLTSFFDKVADPVHLIDDRVCDKAVYPVHMTGDRMCDDVADPVHMTDDRMCDKTVDPVHMTDDRMCDKAVDPVQMTDDRMYDNLTDKAVDPVHITDDRKCDKAVDPVHTTYDRICDKDVDPVRMTDDRMCDKTADPVHMTDDRMCDKAVDPVHMTDDRMYDNFTDKAVDPVHMTDDRMCDKAVDPVRTTYDRICDKDVDPVHLTDDRKSNTAVAEDENNNTNKTKSPVKMFHGKHSPSDDYVTKLINLADELQGPLSLCVLQPCVAQAERSTPNENIDQIDCITGGAGETACVMASACVDNPQCDFTTCSEPDNRPTVEGHWDVKMIDGDYARCQGESLGETWAEAVDTEQSGSTEEYPLPPGFVARTWTEAPDVEPSGSTEEYSLPPVWMQDDEISEARRGGHADRAYVSETRSLERATFKGVEHHRQSKECDAPRSRLCDAVDETRCYNDTDDFDVISRDASQKNRDNHSVSATHDDRSCAVIHDDRSCAMTHDVALTNFSVSYADIYKMLDDIDTPVTQLISVGNAPVSPCGIEVNDDTDEFPSLTHLLEVVEDLQTSCLDGNINTDYLNEVPISEVDVVTVDGAISEREQSTVEPLCCSVEGRCSCVMDDVLCTGSLHQQQLSGELNTCISSNILPRVPPPGPDVATFNMGESDRCYDSESLQCRWVDTVKMPNGYSEDVTWRNRRPSVVALQSHPTISRQVCSSPLTARKPKVPKLLQPQSSAGGDICQTTIATHVSAESNTEAVSLTKMSAVASRSQYDYDTNTAGLAPIKTGKTRRCESQNGETVAAHKWTVTPSGGMSVKLSRVARTPSNRQVGVTWSVEKCGDCSLRFSVNKQHVASAADKNNDVIPVSRDTTKRRKLF